MRPRAGLRTRYVATAPVRLVLSLALLSLMGVGAACRPAAVGDATSSGVALRVANAFAPLSTELAVEYRRRLPSVTVETVAAADSSGVIEALEQGTADVGIALADVAYAAYWTRVNRGGDESIRGISLLQPLLDYVIVRPGSGIRRLSDLNGRTVGVGPRASSTTNVAYLVLEAFGIQATVKNLTGRDVVTPMLKEGAVDAVFVPGYIYPDEQTYSAIQSGAYLIPIEGPEVDRLRLRHPFVRQATIPRDIYPGQNQLIPTVGIDMVVLCRRDLDASLAYQVTAQLFEAYPSLSRVEASLRFLNIDEAPATPVPLHPGAARFFRERELSR